VLNFSCFLDLNIISTAGWIVKGLEAAVAK